MSGKEKDENIDFLVFSGHKLYAPFGSGVIVGLKNGLKKKFQIMKVEGL